MAVGMCVWEAVRALGTHEGSRQERRVWIKTGMEEDGGEKC